MESLKKEVLKGIVIALASAFSFLKLSHVNHLFLTPES